jgi:hypothetical protein
MSERKLKTSSSIAQLAFIELERKDWSLYRDIKAFLDDPITSSEYIPETIRSLFSADTPDEINKRYWEIDNHVVVQGRTFEVAEHLIPVMMASLDQTKGSAARASVLELIFQMVAYYSGEPDDPGLTDRCRARAREGLWDMYRIFMEDDDDDSEAAAIILEVIETDPERLAAFRYARQNNAAL